MWSHGSFFWNELMTRDVQRAKTFYETVLGWTFDPMPMPAGSDGEMPSSTYWVAKSAGMPVAGMMEMTGPQFDGVPDHWFGHIAVDDVDMRAGRIESAGGALLRAPFDVEGVGRIAIVRDVTGTALGLITPVEPEDRVDAVLDSAGAR